jgi:hypothetical protein
LSRGLRTKPYAFRGEELVLREPAALERLEFGAIATQKTQVDAVAYAIERHVFKPADKDGPMRPRFTRAESLELAMSPVEEFGEVLNLVAEINLLKAVPEKKTSPAGSDSSTG